MDTMWMRKHRLRCYRDIALRMKEFWRDWSKKVDFSGNPHAILDMRMNTRNEQYIEGYSCSKGYKKEIGFFFIR